MEEFSTGWIRCVLRHRSSFTSCAISTRGEASDNRCTPKLEGTDTLQTGCAQMKVHTKQNRPAIGLDPLPSTICNLNCRNQAWLLKNSFQGISTVKFLRKLLNVRSPRTLKIAEITVLVPFSTATG